MEGHALGTAIHTLDDGAESILEEMGLTGAIMNEICRRGLAEYFMATPYHPSNAAGTFMYHELVHAKRELLVPKGWDFAEESLSFTFNTDLSIALAVSSGNIYTGIRTRNPSSKYPKGPTTHDAVVGNAIQLGLFDDFPNMAEFAQTRVVKHVDFNKFQTWWLIHYVDLSQQEMRAELSLPTRISDTGEINQWETRIILDPIRFDEDPDVKRVDNGPDDQDFNVDVRRKA